MAWMVRTVAMAVVLLLGGGLAHGQEVQKQEPGGSSHRFASAVIQEMNAFAKMAKRALGVSSDAVHASSKGATAAAQASSTAVAAKAAGASAAAAAAAADGATLSKVSKKEKLEVTRDQLAEMLKIMKSWSPTAHVIHPQPWWPENLKHKLNLSGSVKPEWRKNTFEDLTQKLEKIQRRIRTEADKGKANSK